MNQTTQGNSLFHPIGNKSLFWRLLIVLLVLVLTASACGGKDDSAGVQSSGGNRSSNSQNQTANDNGDGENETAQETAQGFIAIEGLTDSLAFVQGNSLYLTRFDGQEPILLKESIHPPTLALSPDGTGVAYTAIEGVRSRYLTVTNVDTLENRQVFRTSSEFGFLGPMSPNNEWVVVFNFPNAQAVRMDGTESHRIGAIQNQGLTQFWLSDNTLLIIEQPFDNNGQPLPNTVRQFDPVTGEDRELSTEAQTAIGSSEFVQPQQQQAPGNDVFEVFQQIVMEQLGVEIFGFGAPAEDENLDEVVHVVGPPPPAAIGVGTGPELCGEWRFEYQPLDAEPEVLVTFPNTLFINNFNVLEDGTLIFERWYNENCDINLRRAALMRLVPGGEAEVLTDRIDPGTSVNYGFFFADTGPRTSLSSNQRFVAWIGGGLEVGEAMLYVTDLQTDQTYLLRHGVREGSNTTGFLDDIAFNAVLWVPQAQ